MTHRPPTPSLSDAQHELRKHLVASLRRWAEFWNDDGGRDGDPHVIGNEHTIIDVITAALGEFKPSLSIGGVAVIEPGELPRIVPGMVEDTSDSQ